jgi:hypothetical protein
MVDGEGWSSLLRRPADAIPPEVMTMRRLVFKDPATSHDTTRLVAVCAERGFTVDPQDASLAWRTFSDRIAAEWLDQDPYTDHELWEILLEYLREPLP